MYIYITGWVNHQICSQTARHFDSTLQCAFIFINVCTFSN